MKEWAYHVRVLLDMAAYAQWGYQGHLGSWSRLCTQAYRTYTRLEREGQSR